LHVGLSGLCSCPMRQEHYPIRWLTLVALTTTACASAAPDQPLARAAGQGRPAQPVDTRADLANPDPAHAQPVLDKASEADSMVALATVEGEATYYASKFDGRRTANGTIFRNSELYAAHRTFPFGTVVRVTNLRNGRSVVVRVVDRGPWGSKAQQQRTIIDVSQRAARELDFIARGRVQVRVDVLQWGDASDTP